MYAYKKNEWKKNLSYRQYKRDRHVKRLGRRIELFMDLYGTGEYFFRWDGLGKRFEVTGKYNDRARRLWFCHSDSTINGMVVQA
jgi:hypothetical protein